MTEWVDGRNFRPGTPALIFGLGSPLFQTQINGLLSLALVLLRVVAACCTAPLVWTITLVLLEARGLKLSEISRLNNYRIPVIFRPKAKKCVAWLVWTMVAMVLLWPPNFAAPVANSSLAWDPRARDLDLPAPIEFPIRSMNANDFWRLRASEWQMGSLMTSVIWSGASPEYAFTSTGIPLRRYFYLPMAGVITTNSTMDLSLPYFDVKIQWIDARSDSRTKNITFTEYSDYVGSRTNGPSRAHGSVIVMRNDIWDRAKDFPKKAEKFVDKRLVGVNVNQYRGTGSPDGTSCPRDSPYFASIPNLEPAVRIYSVEKEWSVDCYQVGVATIQAGIVHGTDCHIDLIGFNHASATCITTQDFARVSEDWIAPIATNMLSEVLKSAISLDFARPWLVGNNSLEQYTINAMTLGYHAAWSSAVTMLGVSENGTYRRAIPMIRASVDRSKLLVWLSMQLTMTIAAALVWVALKFSTAKFVRDTTLVPLRLDLSEVTHHKMSDGLCDATSLDQRDHGLPIVKFKKGDPEIQAHSKHCRHRIVFVDANGVELH
ncbi:hypothetical protein GQ44DRAFT_719634 [Phaeosphaeriaceae sp. PMI808]|nr:hypothetical protein GQ44DRAFT_719634 [Phaeosphaeriaceae sp. PMI808]